MYAIKKKAMVSSARQSETRIMMIARKGSDFLTAHQKNLTLASAVLAAVFILGAGYTLFSNRTEKHASTDLAAATAAYEGANNANPDYTKALELFRAVQSKYPRTKNGAIARYYAGNSLANMNQYADALSEYQSFVKQYSGEKALLGLVYQRMGYTYQSLGNNNESLKAFEQAESILGLGVASIELARLHEAMGNQAEARKKYEQIAEKLKGTPLAAEAASRIPRPEAAAPQSEKPAEKTEK